LFIAGPSVYVAQPPETSNTAPVHRGDLLDIAESAELDFGQHVADLPLGHLR